MYGREDIEWQDRAWRLLENKGQVEADNWILSGAAIGAVTVGVAGRSGKLPAELNGKIVSAVLGGAGLGLSAGTVGCWDGDMVCMGESGRRGKRRWIRIRAT